MPGGQVSRKKSCDRWIKNNPKKAKELQRKADAKYYKNNKDKINKQQREYRQYKKPEAACEIIMKHHEDMKDDPERLTTEFMKSIVNIECDD